MGKDVVGVDVGLGIGMGMAMGNGMDNRWSLCPFWELGGNNMCFGCRFVMVICVWELIFIYVGL